LFLETIAIHSSVAAMYIPFSEKPGRHERHFRRRLNADLFPRPVRDYTSEQLLEVQRLDHGELISFLNELRRTVQQAVELKPNEETQVILDLKADLERLYETASGLADDHDNNKAAIVQLVAVIMANVRRGATGDTLAEQELLQEETARATHFRLLQHSVVADLLHPESLVESDEIVPVLLLESGEGLAAALEMFDQEQLMQLYHAAQELLQGLPPETGNLQQYRDRLVQMEQSLQETH